MFRELEKHISQVQAHFDQWQLRLDSTIMEIAMHRQIAPCILLGQRRGGIERAMHQMMAIFGI